MMVLLRSWTGRALLVAMAVTVIFYADCATAAGEQNLAFWYSHMIHGQKSATYQANVEALFTELNSKASTIKFYNSTIGDGEDRAYGLYLCPEDVPLRDCQVCLQDASSGISPECPEVNGKAKTCYTNAYTWHDDCFLHYADWNFFGDGDDIDTIICGTENATKAEDDAARQLMSRLVERAWSNVSMFAAGSERGVRGRVICTRDLDGAACRRCLSEGLTALWSPPDEHCKMKDSGRIATTGCSLMFSRGSPAHASEPAPVPVTAPATEPEVGVTGPTPVQNPAAAPLASAGPATGLPSESNGGPKCAYQLIFVNMAAIFLSVAIVLLSE